MAIDYTALKTELQTDPTSLGYAATVASGQDGQTAAVINLARGAILIKRTDIAPNEVAVAIDVNDYTALPTTPTNAQLSTERRFLSWLAGILGVTTIRLTNEDGTDTPVLTNFKAMFAAGTGTRTRLAALATRTGSRAEQLFGAGSVVQAADVAKALRG